MKKFISTILILGIVCTIMACKKNTADTAGSTGNTAAETSESAEAASYEPKPMETVDSVQIDLEEGQAGEVAPD